MEFSSVSSPIKGPRNLHDVESHDDWYDDDVDDSFDAFEMGREHSKRCNQFYTIGYRDGLIAGKEASLQEGFNDGFKQSVLVGHRFGYVRGITSALNSLPGNLKDELVGTAAKKSKLDTLHESIRHISTNKALQMFHSSISSNDSPLPNFHSEDPSGSILPDPDDESCSHRLQLARFSQDVDSLLQELPAIKMQSAIQENQEGK